MSYNKNVSNQSGLSVDNLNVNISATIANISNVVGLTNDYIGVNAIGGSKAFANNVGFYNGITAATGSSVINNLTTSGDLITTRINPTAAGLLISGKVAIADDLSLMKGTILTSGQGLTISGNIIANNDLSISGKIIGPSTGLSISGNIIVITIYQ